MNLNEILTAVVAVTAAASATACLWPRWKVTLVVLPILAGLCFLGETQAVSEPAAVWWWAPILGLLFLSCVAADPERADPFAKSWRRFIAAMLPLVLLIAFGIMQRLVINDRSGSEAVNSIRWLLGPLIICVVAVGTASYGRIGVLRQQNLGGKPHVHLARTITYTLATVVTVVATSWLLVKPSKESSDSQVLGSLPVLVLGAVVCLAGTVRACVRRPTLNDDKLRVDRLAFWLGAIGLIVIGGQFLLTLITGTSSVGGFWNLYVGFVSALIALLYVEELLTTPVLLQLVHPASRSVVIALGSGLVMGLASATVMTVGLLPSSRTQLSFSQVTASVLGFALSALAVACCNAILAFSTSAGQQITEETTFHNAVQSSALYLFLAISSCLMGSGLMASWNSGSGGLVPAVSLWMAVPAVGIVMAFAFTRKENKRHLVSQRSRLVSIDMRSLDTTEQGLRRLTFVNRLGIHIQVQSWIPVVLLVATGILILALLDYLRIPLPSG